MSKRKHERDKQTIGNRGYTVSMRAEDVILSSDKLERNLTPEEALLLLNWLEQHKSELYRYAQESEVHDFDRLDDIPDSDYYINPHDEQ